MDPKKLKKLAIGLIVIGLVVGFIPRGSNPVTPDDYAEMRATRIEMKQKCMADFERTGKNVGVQISPCFVSTLFDSDPPEDLEPCGSTIAPNKGYENASWCRGDVGTMQTAVYGSVLGGAGILIYLWLKKDEDDQAGTPAT